MLTTVRRTVSAGPTTSSFDGEAFIIAFVLLGNYLDEPSYDPITQGNGRRSA